MKKTMIFLLILCLCAVLAGADGYPVKTDTKTRKVVSEIKTFNWTGKTGWFVGPTTKIIVEKYDKQGQLLSSELFYLEMNLIEKTVYSYNDNTVKKTTTNHENKVIRTSTIQYEENKITETVLRSDKTVFFKTISVPDNRGRISILNHYNDKDELLFNKVYKYSPVGGVNEISVYNPDGTYAVRIDISYDSFDKRGNWLSRGEYYAYGDVYSRPRDYVVRKIEYWGDDNEE